jgi:hypothetical protein
VGEDRPEGEYPGVKLIETGGSRRAKEMPKWHGHVGSWHIR